MVESELILLGTDYDNEGKPIAYLGREMAGELKYAGTAFITLSGSAREELQDRIARGFLPSERLLECLKSGTLNGSSLKFLCVCAI